MTTKPTISHRGNGSLQIIIPREQAQAGASPVPVVNVTDLNAVIAQWGNIRDTALTSHPASQPPVQPPVPPVGTLQPLDPQNFSPTTTPIIFTNRSVTTCGSAFKAGNASPLDRLEFHNVKVRTQVGAPANEGYGIYIGAGVGWLILDQFDAEVARADNDYVVRGNPRNVRSNDSRYVNTGLNKSCVRLYGVLTFNSVRDLFQGDELHLGGPAANSWDPHQEFTGEFKDGRIACTKIQVFNETVVVFRSMDFTGSGPITNWKTGKSTYINCTKDGAPLNKGDSRHFSQNDGLDGVTIQ